MDTAIVAKLAKFPRSGAIFSRLFLSKRRRALQTAGFRRSRTAKTSPPGGMNFL